ncbi:MAG: hypothetical protein APR55_06465 [Methanolinea sp. SDB]|nr:MAG: hypothetical protein APR55_06465 [Methanolinea sp. SDB]
MRLSHQNREISPVSHDRIRDPVSKNGRGIAPDLVQVQDFSEEASGFFLYIDLPGAFSGQERT